MRSKVAFKGLSSEGAKDVASKLELNCYILNRDVVAN